MNEAIRRKFQMEGMAAEQGPDGFGPLKATLAAFFDSPQGREVLWEVLRGDRER